MTQFADTYLSTSGQGTEIGQVISAPTDNACGVRIGGFSTTVRITGGVTVVLNDIVLIIRHGSTRFIISTIEPAPAVPAVPDPTAVTPPPSEESPDPDPEIRVGTLIVAPVGTSTYRDGAWRTDLKALVDSSDVLQGRWTTTYGINTGCAFYGDKPSTLIGATVTGGTLHVKRISAGVFGEQTATLWLITEKTRPSGAPTLSNAIAGPSLPIDTIMDFTLPTAWVGAIADGTHGGIAVYVSSSAPYMKFAGLNTYSTAFYLTIDWYR
jgi:hypothetical protein